MLAIVQVTQYSHTKNRLYSALLEQNTFDVVEQQRLRYSTRRYIGHSLEALSQKLKSAHESCATGSWEAMNFRTRSDNNSVC